MKKKIILEFNDPTDRIDKETLSEISGNLVCYLAKDYPEYFDFNYELNDEEDDEEEIEPIYVETTEYFN
jgi:hypothetical protein